MSLYRRSPQVLLFRNENRIHSRLKKFCKFYRSFDCQKSPPQLKYTQQNEMSTNEMSKNQVRKIRCQKLKCQKIKCQKTKYQNSNVNENTIQKIENMQIFYLNDYTFKQTALNNLQIRLLINWKINFQILGNTSCKTS